VRRREFITLVGGSAATRPFAARAAQGERVRRVTFLSLMTQNDPDVKLLRSAFHDRLHELGWLDGRDVRIEYRWAGDQPDRLPALATELVSRKLGLTVPPTMLAIADEVIE
jgi:putative tryptophan/tyrosine transport system substrate-binding protein